MSRDSSRPPWPCCKPRAVVSKTTHGPASVASSRVATVKSSSAPCNLSKKRLQPSPFTWRRRQIFAERLPDLVAPFARRTARRAAHPLRAACALGGAPGARHLAAEGISTSVRTLLRLLRAAPLPEEGPMRVLGVDDWSRRMGRDSGTILVNLETHTVIDLLPGRPGSTPPAALRRATTR